MRRKEGNLPLCRYTTHDINVVELIQETHKQKLNIIHRVVVQTNTPPSKKKQESQEIQNFPEPKKWPTNRPANLCHFIFLFSLYLGQFLPISENFSCFPRNNHKKN